MPSTGYESSDCLALFNQLAGRPSSGDAISDASKYTRMAQAQDQIIIDLASIAPKALYNAPTAMSSADSGKTWTFGSDGNSYTAYPLAAFVYPSLAAIPDYPWQPGRDYLDEGDLIRIPNNQSWGGSLYWQGILQPQAMSGSVQPAIVPPSLRLLIPVRAARDFCLEGGRNPELAALCDARYTKDWGHYVTQLRKHLRGRGRIGPLVGTYMGAAIGATW